MAVEQIRPDSRAEQGGRLKTQDLNVGAGTAILFKIPRRAADSFISMPRYIQNEGMPEVRANTPAALFGLLHQNLRFTSGITFILMQDQIPTYAIQPAGPFALEIYGEMLDTLQSSLTPEGDM